MIIATSLLDDLLARMPQIRPQIYFKSSMTALSHAMEDQVLAGADKPLVVASFQRERFYRQESHRYLRISERTGQVYVLAAPEADFSNRSDEYETIAFDPKDGLANEWHLVVLGKQEAACLICRERLGDELKTGSLLQVDQGRRFEGIWTFDREIVCHAAELLLQRIVVYRPELAPKIGKALLKLTKERSKGFKQTTPDPFAERLVTYLQAGQYKLSKAYQAIAAQERKERLVNSITTAIRRSLDPEEVLQVGTRELGQVLLPSRCLIYRARSQDESVRLNHEFLKDAESGDRVDDHSVPSLYRMDWDLANNPIFQQVAASQEAIFIENVSAYLTHETLTQSWPPNAIASVQRLAKTGKIQAWLMVPVLHQNRVLGMIELHYCHPHPAIEDELELVNAIAHQIGTALIQAESFANLEDLNQQLEALERTRSNLIAIVGHELRTPLSTILVCLESLASEPDMPFELQQVMLQSGLEDADRMRKLIQDFLTLSRLESGRIKWLVETQPLQECIDLALSSLKNRYDQKLPSIEADLTGIPPLVRVDGEWLVEALSKLLDNACKFTEATGRIQIQAVQRSQENGDQSHMLEVIVSDTGRGIEPSRLEAVFERFYQEEGSLRRSVGGTGLGLAICRQIVSGWGGTIWAESDGKNRGSAFHFTIPIVEL